MKLKSFIPLIAMGTLILSACGNKGNTNTSNNTDSNSENDDSSIVIDAETVLDNFVNNILTNNYVMRTSSGVSLTVVNANQVYIEYENKPEVNECFFTANENETFYAKLGENSLSEITYASNKKVVDTAKEFTLDYLLDVSEGNLYNVLYNDTDNILHFFTTDGTTSAFLEYFAKFFGYGQTVYSNIGNFDFTFDKADASSLRIYAEVKDSFPVVYEDIDITVTFGVAKDHKAIKAWLDKPTYPAAPTEWTQDYMSLINSVFDQQYGEIALPFPSFASYTLLIDKDIFDTSNTIHVTDKYAKASDVETYKKLLADHDFQYNEEAQGYCRLLNDGYKYYSKVSVVYSEGVGIIITAEQYYIVDEYNSFDDINSLIQSKDFLPLEETTNIVSWYARDDWARAKNSGWYFWDYDMFLEVTVTYGNAEQLANYIKVYTDQLVLSGFKYSEGEDYYGSLDGYYSFRWADRGNGVAELLFKHERALTERNIDDTLDYGDFPDIDFASACESFSARDLVEYMLCMNNVSYPLYLSLTMNFVDTTQRDAFLDSYTDDLEREGFERIDTAESTEPQWGTAHQFVRVRVSSDTSVIFTFIVDEVIK